MKMEEATETAFALSPSLGRKVLHAYNSGIAPSLLAEICAYIISLPSLSAASTDSQSSSKKRKLEPEEPLGTAVHSFHHTEIRPPEVYFDCSDVSFSTPARKKLRLQFVSDGINTSKKQIRLLNPASGEVEHALRGEDIAEFFCLPVPDKPQRQRNFVIIPKHGALGWDGKPAEPIVWTANETKATYTTTRYARYYTEESTFVEVMLRELNGHMAGVRGQETVLPDEREFASAVTQSHRKGEKAFHVKAFKGSKEGYLFPLPNGILFGFKKPLQFFPFAAINSVSFTSVLQRTFNLVITVLEPSDPANPAEAETKEHEFSMLDQADFGGIDDYIKRHNLSDASMAADRRAKAYNVNKPKANGNGEAANGGTAGEEESELAKAEAEIQDAEDEEEEDYDPSGGESEGSGEDSDEEEEGGEGEVEGEYDEEDEDGEAE